MSDLTFTPTEDLWDEITRRHDAVVMVTLTDAPSDKDAEAKQVWFKSRTTCIGLLAFGLKEMLLLDT